MTVEAKLKVTLQDNASKGLSQLEQKIKQIQQRILEDTKKLNQDSANADKQSNEKKKKGWSELEAHIKQIQQRIADAAKKAAQDAAEAERHAKEQKKKGWSELEAHIKRIQQQLADDAKRKAEQEAAADRAAKEKRKRGWSELEAHVKQIQQRIVDDAKRKAEQEAEADRQAKEKRKRGWSEMEAHVKRIQQKMVDDAKRAAQAEADAAKRALKEIEDARKTLGARSHAQITEQMNRTRQAYQTLARSGVLSWREQAQAADAMRRKVTELTNEMGRLTAAQKGMNALRFGASATAGLIGGVAGTAYAMKEPVKNAMEYNKTLAGMSNIAYDDRDVAGRERGIKEMEAAINKATEESKGTVSVYGITDMLNQVLAGGRVPIKEGLENLPFLAKFAGANDVDPQVAGALLNSLFTQRDINGVRRFKTQEDIRAAMNMIVATGQASSFETKNIGMFLPQQIATAQLSGMTDKKGLRDILTLDATATTTNGTSDEAGTSVSNLLREIMSPLVANKYADYMEEKHKIKGANLYADMGKAARKGVSSIGFMQAFLDHEMKIDPEVKGLIKQRMASKNPEEMALLESVIDIKKGEIISKIIPEIRAGKAIMGYQNKGYRQEVEKKIDAAMSGKFTPNEDNFETMKRQSYAKAGVLTNSMAENEHKAMGMVADKVGDSALGINGFLKNHPTLGMAVPFVSPVLTGAGYGLGAMTAIKWMMPKVAEGAVRSPGLMAYASTAFSRAAPYVSSVASRAGGILSSAPLLRNISSLFRFGGGMNASVLVGDMSSKMFDDGIRSARAKGIIRGPAPFQDLNHGVSNVKTAFDSIVSKLSSEKDSLGSAVSNLMHWKPDPVKVDTQTHVTVALAPGLVPVAQSSKSTSTGTGANTTSATVGGKGNLWTGAPK